MIFLTSLVFGASLPAELQPVVSKALGKDIPEKYICASSSELGSSKTVLVAVGIKVKGVGCSLKGVVYEGNWVSPEQGLVAILPTYSSLPRAEQEAVSKSYVRDILLAFQQPYGPSEISSSGKSSVVSTPVTYRIPKGFHSVDATSVVQFNAQGNVTSNTHTDPSEYRSRLVLRVHQVKGMSQDQVEAALKGKGKLTQTCFYKAWMKDLRTTASTRLAWDIKKGTPPIIKVIRTTAEKPLMQCYSNALGKVDFPSDGHVELTFGIQRLKQAN